MLPLSRRDIFNFLHYFILTATYFLKARYITYLCWKCR